MSEPILYTFCVCIDNQISSQGQHNWNEPEYRHKKGTKIKVKVLSLNPLSYYTGF